jgi:uncharacterized protein (DUF342 family)
MEHGTYNLQQDLTLKLSEDGRTLVAELCSVEKPEERVPIQLAWFREQLAEHGLDKLRLNKEAIGQCIQQYNDGACGAVITIGECVDAEFSLKFSDDNMQVTLSCTPAQGGKPVTKKQILDELYGQGITFGVNEQAIDEALQGDEVHDQPIAQGKAAENGKDGYFEKLIEDIRDRRPRIDEQGRAYYNDITQFVTVKAGDALIRRIPPTEGIAGKTVKGQVIPPTPGEAAMFADNLPGIRIAENNSNLLLADIAGQPVFVENGALVESTITVNDVDQNTGNIVFEGSVMVNGNVTTGMKIEVEGDALIKGMVEEASEITAGGDIIVQQGIIGRGAVFDDHGKPGKGTARLTSKGSISARFIENAMVNAGRCVEVKELIAHSDVSAKHHVTVGGKGAKRGHIMGGVTRAEQYIQAEVLGSPASVSTRIIAGVNPECTAALHETIEKLETKNTERTGLAKVLGQAARQQTNNRKEMLQRLNATLDQLASDINQLNEQYEQHNAELERLKQAKIIVKKKAYNAVEITIADLQEKIAEDKNGGTFLISEGELTQQFE